MSVPTVPFYGKDTDRLAKLDIAYKIIKESASFQRNWPSTVDDNEIFKTQIDYYRSTFEAAYHFDRRAIAARIAAANEVSTTWQKIVNYAYSTKEDHSEMLERMGVTKKKSPRTWTSTPSVPEMTDFAVVNIDKKGYLRASCSRDRRRYSYEIWITEGDPRIEEGWFFKQTFGDCTNMEISGFQPGKEISLRCRIIGRDNIPGPWSHTITIMVT
ncbi:hypothetical protein GMST_04420 [Geomonas silvestris]|uniref:Uncharacterized protein n=1 Tax=Geomonas silvestris TaxID=2740184 RepID=A0A6V8MDR4_9BACT|nr:hypothetical protein [Geomonas silvestris]GFO58117.1 hypothetical protein GMST_04420 [Geomonas silvestris]